MPPASPSLLFSSSLWYLSFVAPSKTSQRGRFLIWGIPSLIGDDQSAPLVIKVWADKGEYKNGEKIAVVKTTER